LVKEVKTVTVMIVILLVGKGLGLVREMLFAAQVGGGELADAFMFASQMPRLLTEAMFAAAITASFIPVFNGQLARFGKQQAFNLANNFLNIIVAASAAVTVLAMLLAPMIVGFGAADFAPYYAGLTVTLLRIALPLIVLSCAAFTFVGILQSFDQFYIPAAMSVAANGVVIAYYLLFFDSFGVYGLAVAFLAGWVLQLAIQLPFLKKYGYKYSFGINLKDPAFGEVLKLVAPAMVFVWVLPVNLQINIFAVTSIVGGSVALGLANTVYMIVTGVFVLSVANVIFPKLSRLAVEEDEHTFGATLKGSMKGLLYLLIPITVGMIVVAEPLVRVLFLRGEFTYEASALTTTALSWFALGIIGFGIQNILARGFFSYKEGRTPLITGLIAVAINAVISFGLVNQLGIVAPALGSALAMTICAVVLFVVMYTRNRSIWDATATFDIVKMAVCAVPMGMAAHFIISSIAYGGTFADIAALAVASVVGIFMYLVLTYVLKVSEARLAVGFISNKYRRNG